MTARVEMLLERLEKQFGEGLDLDAVLFLVGVQELGRDIENSRSKKRQTSCILPYVGY